MDFAAITNPFATFKLDDVVAIPPGDVPELHEAALEQCHLAIATTRKAAASSSVMVIGEAGSGKSHMIAQLRKAIATDPKGVLTAVRMGGANVGCIWRHLRERIASDLLRPLPNKEFGENGLLRVLRNRFPKWAEEEGSASAILKLLFGKPNMAQLLSQQLDDFAAKETAFDYKLLKALPHFVTRELTAIAQSWLRGQQLAEEDFRKLGLPPEYPSDLEQELISRSVVLSLLQLAGDRTTLVIVFDEVEAIQTRQDDGEVLGKFAKVATELIGEAGPRVVITSIRPMTHLALTKSIEVSNFQKMTQHIAQIPPLDWEQTVRIYRARLIAEPSCQAARVQFPQDPDWPLGRRFLEDTFAANQRVMTPRHLILACRVEFQELKKGRAPLVHDVKKVVGPMPPPPPPINEELNRIWEGRRDKLLAKPHGIKFDNVFAILLPWLVEQFENSFVRIQDNNSALGDVSLTFQPRAVGEKAIGISFCNHEPMQLWRRLDRLLKQWKDSKGKLLSSLIVLRSDFAATKDGSKERLEALKKVGVLIAVINKQQLAELAAYQAMLTATMSGEMTRLGKPLEEPQFAEWVRDNLSASAKDLLDELFRSKAGTVPETTTPTAKKKKPVTGARK